MSEYESLRSEIMTVMDSLNEYGRTVNRYMAVVNDQVAAVWADNAELRDEINAVSNRVESLTRAVMADPAEVAAAIVNDANRSTLREVRDTWRECSECGTAIYTGADRLIYDGAGLHTCTVSA